jgi:mannose-6-phosphate isomerase-like protein (cupin superfamily)
MSEIRMTGPEDGEVALFGVAEIVIAPHTEGPPQHRHGEHDEGFYVVSGTVRFTSGDSPRGSSAPANSSIFGSGGQAATAA